MLKANGSPRESLMKLTVQVEDFYCLSDDINDFHFSCLIIISVQLHIDGMVRIELIQKLWDGDENYIVVTFLTRKVLFYLIQGYLENGVELKQRLDLPLDLLIQPYCLRFFQSFVLLVEGDNKELSFAFAEFFLSCFQIEKLPSQLVEVIYDFTVLYCNLVLGLSENVHPVLLRNMLENLNKMQLV